MAAPRKGQVALAKPLFGTTATHAECGPPAPTKEEKGFGAFAHHPIASERAKTTFGSGAVPERSCR